MFKNKWFSVLLLLLMNLKSLALAETLFIHGSTTFNATVFEPFKNRLHDLTGLVFNILSNGSGRGLEDLLADNADVAMISAPLESFKKTNTDSKFNNLQEFQVASSTVAFTVNKNNKVKKITLDKLYRILTGKINNWRDLGGSDSPIIIVLEDAKGGVRNFVQDSFVKGKITGDLKEVLITPEIIKIVADFPNTIGISGLQVTKSNNNIDVMTLDNDLVQKLFLVTKGEPSASIRKLINAILQLKIS